MKGPERRKRISNILNTSQSAVKGNELAETFNVSRQVIVQDIALLRAEGHNIIATPQGYMMLSPHQPSSLRSIMCNHTGIKEMKEELDIILKNGYSYDNEEQELDIICIAVPIFNNSGTVNYALSVSVPKNRFTPEKEAIILESLLETAGNISKNLGYLSPLSS